MLLLLAVVICGARAGVAAPVVKHNGNDAAATRVFDLSRFEGRTVATVEVAFEGVPRDPAIEAELRALLTVAPGAPFAAVRVRESLQALFDSGRVANARVEATDAGSGGGGGAGAVALRFLVKPQVRVSEVRIEIASAPSTTAVERGAGAAISSDELRARVSLLEPGARLSEQTLRNSADSLQVYLRDRGYYRADVVYSQVVDAGGMGAVVTFRVMPNEAARVEQFNLNVAGFDPARVRPDLRLQPGAPFTRSALGEDVKRIRQAIIAEGFLAPQLNDPQILIDSARNTITVNLSGGIGPRVNVQINGFEIKDKQARELLPVKREGTLDYSAIVEGARRLRNRLQEDGYFFAEITQTCAVPGAPGISTSTAANTTTLNAATLPPTTTANATAPSAGLTLAPAESCENLNAAQLSGQTVNITYDVERGRRFRLSDVRVEGTNKLSYEELADELRTEPSNPLRFIPLLGSGRGYTSREILERDRETVKARMRDLGYRKAEVEVRQGVALEGENLIITFAVTEGPLTRVAGVEVRGNGIYTAERLRDEPCAAARLRSEPCVTVESPYSRSLVRTDGERVRALYARNGYVDAEVRTDVVELPRRADGDEQVRVVYNVNEGGKVFINHIIINGNETSQPDGRLRTNPKAIREAIPLREGEALRADSLTEAERVLYETNAFRQVIIRTEPAGETVSGFRKRDVIIDVEELKPRRQDFIFGFSTDGGPLGGYEIRNDNLFGELRQGALRARASRQHQLFRLEFFDPRFRSYGQTKFSPLSISAQYQRDVSVTRFFRTTIDRGNFGVVQRLDAEGRPVNELGMRTGEPTINRFTFNLESQRVLEQRSRTILFVRYNYEDVRLFNIGSLLVAPILRPDRNVRLSRFGATVARDTRDRQFDPTRGEFLTLDYNLAVRQLGGNLSFSKVQATYRRYKQFGGVARGTVLAGGFTFGAANLFNPRDRDDVPGIQDVDRTLPISERFFSGGSTTLRGFAFDEAGPRVAVCPGTLTINAATDQTNCTSAVFRDRNGKPLALNPFIVPVGGNALAVVNLEARVPLNRVFQVVPFYDGGNVFRRVGDIFGRKERNPMDDLNTRNLRAQWTHTVGLGLRFKTPLGPLAIDYGFLLNPPTFELPQGTGAPALIRLKRNRIHFRFGQTF